MKKIFSLFTFMFCYLTFAQVDKPKLIVGIVVDQMRPDYLYRYYDDYGDNGFKRLMKEGFNFKNTNYNYMPTYTAPGHSSIYTGTTPAIHGIVGNSWFNKGENKNVYCTYDERMNAVGTSPTDKAGKMSPYRLKSTTVTDELKLDTNFRGKVIGISIKDRGAILPAGHFADGAYWVDDMGNFITSSFYMDNLPNWVEKFNQKKLAQKYINNGWDLLKNKNAYDESTEDNSPYERIIAPKTSPTFPYNLKEIATKEGNLNVVKSTPFGNDLVAEFSKTALINENLGKDRFTDFLAISFSSTDYVGHSFGPRSIEIQDTYLRLDETIANLLSFLDKEVGKGNYLLFLTADHAAAENPNYLKDKGYHVETLNYKALGKEVSDFFTQKYGVNILTDYSNQNIFLNDNIIKENKLDYDTIIRDLKAWLNEKPYISRAYSRDDILRGNPTDYHLSLIERGYDPKQNGDIVVLFDPQYMEYSEVGTTHGSTYMYDTHVPNLWFGWKVKSGESYKRYDITDIAPTISQKVSIPMPNGTKGNLLLEVL
ncbi:alkaline phosphatase family protein [Weeksellaceae bacterium TAE3-ERU29]|nr:alkaline phosphatase family protein [Weeksellaceae bacterium TAE3-ERU29]